MAAKAIQFLGAKLVKMDKPVQLTDYRKKATEKATHKIIATFEIDGRKFKDEEFMIADTGYNIFVGQQWLVEKDVWLHPRTKAIAWPDELSEMAQFSPTIIVDDSKRRMDKRAQADMERRDELMKEEDQQMKVLQILQNPQRSIQAINTRPEEESLSPEIAALHAAIDADPRQERWKRQKLPENTTPFETDQFPTISINAVRSSPAWKTYDGQPIPFPEGEDPEHVQRVSKALPARLAHLEGFFSKKASTRLPPSRPGHDVVLELTKPLEGQPPSYRTPLSLLPLEKETTDDLLKIGFIEPCMEDHAASVLFVPKPHEDARRFCADYRWVNNFIASRLVKAPDVNGTIANCRNAKRYSKIDIIRAFNRLLMHPDSRYLTAFKTRQGTFRWKVLPFGLKVGPAWWQAFINAQLQELLDLFANAYADDVLIYADEDNDEAHFAQVEEVIYRLHNADLQGDIKKSRFNVTQVDYLGMVIEAGKGVRIDPEKMKAILG